MLLIEINKSLSLSGLKAILKPPETVTKISPADSPQLFGPETRLRAHNRYCACAQVCESIKIPLGAT